jgi:hypothetical protein
MFVWGWNMLPNLRLKHDAKLDITLNGCVDDNLILLTWFLSMSATQMIMTEKVVVSKLTL